MASIFFSYSHKDEALRDELEKHLALLKNQGVIDVWHDRRIVAGDELDESIFTQLESADIILLLISADFMSSSYCFSREMKRAMERHEAGEARVIPVILRHCMWHGAPFGKVKAVPRDGRPITSWPDRDEAFADVASEVARAAEVAVSRQAGPVSTSLQRSALGAAQNLRTGFPVDLSGPRSSNLRVKKEFSDKDRDDFLREAFEFICRFFKNSIDAIGERNPDVTGTFDQIDSRRMAGILYRNGKKIAEGSVRLGSGFGKGIAFSQDASANSNSANEILNLESDDQAIYLKPMGLGWGGGREKHLTHEGAAEYLWELFIKNAQ